VTSPWAQNLVDFLIVGDYPDGAYVQIGPGPVITLYGVNQVNTIVINADSDNSQPSIDFTTTNTPANDTARLWALNIGSPAGTGLEMESTTYTNTFNGDVNTRQIARVGTNFSAVYVIGTGNQFDGGGYFCNDTSGNIGFFQNNASVTAIAMDSDGARLNGDYLAAQNGSFRAATGAQLMSSATYVDMTNINFSFTKDFAPTAIGIYLNVTSYVSVVGQKVRWGVRINGVDWDVMEYFYNTANDHRQISGVARVAPGLAAGTYTIQVRWLLLIAAGFSQTDANDFVSCLALEMD
jgi:hypothetical protein